MLSPEERDLLIRTVIGEAGNEPDAGKEAVAHVVMNRVASGRYGKTAADVLNKPNAFEPLTNPLTRARLMGIDPNSDPYKRAAAAVDKVVGGAEDVTGGATHFYAPVLQAKLGRSAPTWAQGEGLTIGGHTFYAPEGKVTRVAQATEPEDIGTLFRDAASGATPDWAIPKRLRKPSATPDVSRETIERAIFGAPETEAEAAPPVAAAEKPPAEGLTVGQLVENPVVAGVGRGLRNVVDTGAEALSSGAASVGDFLYNEGKGAFPKSWRDFLQKSAETTKAGDVSERKAFEEKYKDSTAATIGTVGGEILGSAGPLGLAAKAVKAIPLVTQGMNAVSRITPVGAAAIRGAATGAGANALVSSGYDAPVGEQMATGVAIGAPLGVLGRGVTKLIGGRMGAEDAALADKAINKYGIPLGPAQLSGSPAVKVMDTMVNKLPFTGGTASRESIQAGVNRAVAKTIGEDAEKITPDVMNAARARNGATFESIGQRVPVIPSDQSFANGLAQVARDARAVMEDSPFKPLRNQFLSIVNKFREGQGSISGETYRSITKAGSPLDSLQHSQNSDIRRYASRIRAELDDVMERHAPNDVIGDLQAARKQWWALKTIEDLVEKGGGDISPEALLGAVRTNAKRFGQRIAYGGGGDLAEIAQIGKRFLTPARSSNTAENTAALNMVKLAVGGAAGYGGLNWYDPELAQKAAAGAIPAILAAKMAGAAMRNPKAAQSIVRRAIQGGTPSTERAFTRAAAPAAIAGNRLMLAPPQDNR